VRTLHQVRVLVGGQQVLDLAHELVHALAGLERQVELGEHEAVHVGVDGREGVGGQREREAVVAQAAEHGVVVPEQAASRRAA
jgi:hypothetical protein